MINIRMIRNRGCFPKKKSTPEKGTYSRSEDLTLTILGHEKMAEKTRITQSKQEKIDSKIMGTVNCSNGSRNRAIAGVYQHKGWIEKKKMMHGYHSLR
jgi:hypothetical protein